MTVGTTNQNFQGVCRCSPAQIDQGTRRDGFEERTSATKVAAIDISPSAKLSVAELR